MCRPGPSERESCLDASELGALHLGMMASVIITTRNVDADHVQVTVEDSGPGLDPSGMEKIFEPFKLVGH